MSSGAPSRSAGRSICSSLIRRASSSTECSLLDGLVRLHLQQHTSAPNTSLSSSALHSHPHPHPHPRILAGMLSCSHRRSSASRQLSISAPQSCHPLFPFNLVSLSLLAHYLYSHILLDFCIYALAYDSDSGGCHLCCLAHELPLCVLLALSSSL